MITRILFTLTLMMLIPAAAPAQDQEASPAESAQRTWDDYRVVVDMNIFARQRRIRPADMGFTQTQDDEFSQAAPPQAAYIVLVGLSIVGDRPTAIFEDRRDGAIHKLSIGDQLAGRTVTRITLDDARISSESGEIAVRPGLSLLGEASPIAADNDTTSTADEYSSDFNDDFDDYQDDEDQPWDEDAPVYRATAPDGPVSGDIIQRMRERRQRELEE